MRVAIIGGTGCGGAAVVRALSGASAVVLGISRGESADPPALPAVEWARLDRHDTGALRAALAAFRPDAVVDQIAYTAAEVEALGEALPSGVRRVIVVSSAVVYGPDRPDAGVGAHVADGADGPYTEDDPLSPEDPFAREKAAADRAARSLPGGTVLRLGLLYGPGHPPLTPWGRDPDLRDRLLAGEPLPVPADDPPRLQPIFAEDAAELILRLLTAEAPPPALNGVGDETLSWGELLAAWATAWGTPPPNLQSLSPAAMAARAPAYLHRFLPILLAPTRLATDGRRRFAPDWRPRTFAAGLRAVVSGG